MLFDKADGDFSKPLATVKSDLGAATSLSITHAAVSYTHLIVNAKISAGALTVYLKRTAFILK